MSLDVMFRISSNVKLPVLNCVLYESPLVYKTHNFEALSLALNGIKHCSQGVWQVLLNESFISPSNVLKASVYAPGSVRFNSPIFSNFSSKLLSIEMYKREAEYSQFVMEI